MNSNITTTMQCCIRYRYLNTEHNTSILSTLLSILNSWLHLAQILQYKLLFLFDVLSLYCELLLDLLGGHLPLLSLLLVFDLHNERTILLPMDALTEM